MNTPTLLKALYSDLEWNGSRKEPFVYLTFDDGPVPEATPFVLDTLKQWNAKATFFCIGKNVAENPTIYKRIRTEGHVVGNHTYDHANGWKTRTEDYVASVERCEKLVRSDLFRPPYGKISRAQCGALKSRMRIIMWDVLSADFDQKVSPEQCLRNVTRNTRNGSIIVFHDSKKAFTRMSYALPRFLEYLERSNLQTSVL